ncbi:MAG: DUF7482 domain-containing protein [bacterium]
MQSDRVLPSGPAYTPLRRIVFVDWKTGRPARILRSAEAIRQAAAAGEVTLTGTGIVVNMPMLTWPGGHR